MSGTKASQGTPRAEQELDPEIEKEIQSALGKMFDCIIPTTGVLRDLARKVQALTLERAAKVMCHHCDNDHPLTDGIHRFPEGDYACYAAPLRAVATR